MSNRTWRAPRALNSLFATARRFAGPHAAPDAAFAAALAAGACLLLVPGAAGAAQMGAAQSATTQAAAPSAPTSPGTPRDPAAPAASGYPGMPPVLTPGNLYGSAGAGALSAATAGALSRVYVPELRSNAVAVIDPATRKVVGHFPVGVNPQHIVPAWDMQTLWVTNNSERRTDGSLTPIDPKTGLPGKSIPVDDPYNMYFLPDGSAAIVVAEAHQRLDFRDPHTMALRSQLAVPGCKGINHADFAMDGSYAIFTCEFTAAIAKVDMVHRKVVGLLKLEGGGMPQDIRISPDGKVFFVADMMADGVFVIDGERFTQVGKVPTGVGAHGLYPSRAGTQLYVSNRGSNHVHGGRHGKGSVSVIDFASRTVVKTWPVPGGGSPDMGNVSADGRQLWLSGRFDDEVYVFDTASGAVQKIAVGLEPHGLTVWPQPGRYSLGHTGNMR
jgi:YVTN family beta-propeller protein